MAKQPAKRKRGRPAADNPLGHRVMSRLDDETKDALTRYVQQTGGNGLGTAMRMIVVEKLRAVGLLK